MKNDIHPEYFTNIKTKCSTCGKEREISSTKKDITIDVCSNCHAFYTGVRNNASTAGRIDKFNKKFNR
ncbi:MAG: 50S ribosomal protein L31 [Mycoplasmataceae bacterium]|nr:50S ribosomal protein L31 [Mycoplasmataceae bacterium]